MKKHTLIVLVFLPLLLVFHQSCQEKADNAAVEVANEAEKDPWASEPVQYTLNEKMDMLLDSIHANQQKAAASEAEKIETTLKFIDEIESLASGYDQEKLEAIRQIQVKLAASRYTLATMQDTATMLRYDRLCEQLGQELVAFRSTVPDFDRYSRAKRLLSDILQANNDDLFIRKDYNFYVEEFNTLLKDKKGELKAMGQKYDTLQPFPYFYEDPTL